MAAALLPTLAALPFLELAEQPAGLGDFSLLPALLRIVTFVIAAQEQDDLLAIEVDEDPEQNLLGLSLHLGRLATEHAGDLIGVVACCLTSIPPGTMIRCLIENLRVVSLVEAAVDGSWRCSGLGEGETFEAGGESVDLALKVAGM